MSLNSNRIEGFSLIESMVSLLILSVLVTACWQLLLQVATASRDESRIELLKAVIENPDPHDLHSIKEVKRFRLEQEETDENPIYHRLYTISEIRKDTVLIIWKSEKSGFRFEEFSQKYFEKVTSVLTD